MSQYVGGAKLALSTLPLASPAVYVTVGQVKDIKGPEQSATIVDSTTQDVPDNFKTKLGALVDAGTYTFDIWFDANDATGSALIYANVGKSFGYQLSPKNYVSPFPTITGTLVIQKIGNTWPVDGGQIAQVTMDLSGKPVLVA
jgi:hypothetical protein